MRAVVLLGIGLLIAGVTAGSKTPESKARPEAQGLTLRQEPDRVVLQWSGPVQPPMSDRFTAAFRQLEDDPRRIVISLNSPGGLIEHGQQVMHVIHMASRDRQIDTLVEAGKMCASMCVPIYLVGAERMAHPAARFMFHEASFLSGPKALPPLGARTRDQQLIERARKAAVTQLTDNLFDDDMGPRSVDARWLNNMRAKIRGRDVWLTGRQLVDQGSGVVDKLQ